MWHGLKRLRAEAILLLSLALPILFPRAGGAGAIFASAAAPLLPAMAPAAEVDDEWRQIAFRLMAENADLRGRLLALGEPARLVTMEGASSALRPVRVEAAVLGRDSSLFRGSVLISAGTGAGITEGLPVVVGEALVGLVAEAGPAASRVRLLTDPGCRVWAGIVSGGDTSEGYVAGTGDAAMEMRLVRAGTGRPGDPVFTVATDPRVPRGLLIGTLKSAEDVDRDGVAEMAVTPAVPATRIRFVNVLVPGGR